MADIDYDNMSDEEFLKLSEEDAIEAVSSQTPNEEENQNENVPEEENEDETPNGVQSSDGDIESGVPDGGDTSNDASQGTDGEEEEELPEGNQDPMGENGETPPEPNPKKMIQNKKMTVSSPMQTPKKMGRKPPKGKCTNYLKG
ncbi:hypothetical protein SUFG_00011 [Sulfitobacter phage phiCB2047-B]|uniref:Uncharacterized protein n=1 Tax=Sulfitobacter phage phiCB2047-B TaxID=754046 RepID=M4PYF9_9CAUD|nr:hypothetical protein SUFG_00011 [Sulfitobacter phage phiCB2047-B]AGH07384.1 hypothetical protein SUFG_00011 [Sulfitobacter phage phiCB2047-B]